ncbi:hypothetical protein SAMN05216360_12532 [Methylobacterium phyllostachyos]|uniref:Dit-like phage tail protein N-terminal domain-containing protein n=1 Tax=Methylobacterium phyllostachyos TaxID=582672 RepID=A0A1H0K7P7_9HYPH|nr:hypothetical protein [Methylobacterium phyllostachyos]SDO51926.1 hypothetical protein SAMN05216360_12532 [Methylobacterium phyllostachyos]
MAAGTLTNVLIQYASRRIGPIIPDVVIEEAHQDRLVVTPHPVEGGGFVSDHAYKLNPVVELRVGFSDSTFGIPGYGRARYDALQKLQNDKQPITIFTGKRMYNNMLPVGLSVVTDARSENALIAILALEQITIVSTQTSNDQTTAKVGDTAPPGNQPVVNGGNVETRDVTAQNFAGAYNPGSGTPVGPGAYNLDGTPATGQGFGLNTPGADIPLSQNPNLSGLSPPTEITLPQLSVTSPEPIGGLQGAGPDQYNMFGGGP